MARSEIQSVRAQTPLSSEDLDALLVRVAEGDRDAFTQFYKATSPKVYAMLIRVMRDRDAAQDVLQQAYVAIWKKAASFKPARGPAMAWTVVVARNKALDAMRVVTSKNETVMIDETLPDDSTCTEDLAEATLLRRRLTEALASLPEDMAKAVRLSTEYGFTSQEIADQFGLPHNTVKSWVRRGLKRLRADLPWATLNEAI